MSTPLEVPLDSLETVELPVHDNPCSLILAGDRLISGIKIDDAQARMAKPHFSILRDPVPLAVGATMIQTFGCAFQGSRAYLSATREYSDNSTHTFVVLLLWR